MYENYQKDLCSWIKLMSNFSLKSPAMNLFYNPTQNSVLKYNKNFYILKLFTKYILTSCNLQYKAFLKHKIVTITFEYHFMNLTIKQCSVLKGIS